MFGKCGRDEANPRGIKGRAFFNGGIKIARRFRRLDLAGNIPAANVVVKPGAIGAHVGDGEAPFY